MEKHQPPILGASPVKLFLDFVFCAEVISHVTFLPGFARQDLFENAELTTNEANQTNSQPGNSLPYSESNPNGPYITTT
jgi:hypothetical protein